MAEPNETDQQQRDPDVDAEVAIRWGSALVMSARQGGLPAPLVIAALFDSLGMLILEDLYMQNPARHKTYVACCERLLAHVSVSLPVIPTAEGH